MVMVMSRVMTTCLLWLAILFPSAAFTGLAGSTSAPCATSSKLPLRQLARGTDRCMYHLARFHAVSSRADDSNDEPPGDITNNIEASVTPSKYDEGDPRRALEEFGSLFSLLQAILLEGSTWDNDTLEDKTQEFVRTYLRVFVPGIGYAVTSFAVFGSTILSLLLALAVSGRGYGDVVAAVRDVEPLHNLLEKADPAWGNVAIALVGCEVLSPVILAATLALTPKAMDALRAKLDELGWGEDDIDERAADILRLTN